MAIKKHEQHSEEKGLEDLLDHSISVGTLPSPQPNSKEQQPRSPQEKNKSLPVLSSESQEKRPASFLPPLKIVESSFLPSGDDIHFLADELTEDINKDLKEILFSIQHPLAGKNLFVLLEVVRHLISARAQQMHQEAEVPQQRRTIRIAQTVQLPTRPTLIKPAPVVDQRVSHAAIETPLYHYQPSIAAAPLRAQQRTSIVHIPLVYDEQKRVIVGADIDGEKYTTVEPFLNDKQHTLLDAAKKILTPAVVQQDRALYRELVELARRQGLELSEEDFQTLCYYIERDVVHLGLLMPLFVDKKITKIICEGINKPILIIRDDEMLTTSLQFEILDEVNAFLKHIAAKTYQSLGFDNPILDVTYGDFRIQGTLGTDLVSSRFLATRLPS